MQEFFTTILYQPLFNLLVFFYTIVPGQDIGIAIILLTIALKLVLYPFSKKALQQQRALTLLQPKMEELKVKHKDNREELARQMMELYRQEKVNPFSSCLPLLIQLPFLIAVFTVFRDGLHSGNLDLLYGFMPHPESLNPFTFGGIDLSKPVVVLAVLAGVAQYWQAKMLMHKKPAAKAPGSADEDMMAATNRQMMVIMPVMTVFIGLSLPGGLSLYWLVMTLMTGFQQILAFRHKPVGAIVEGEVVNK